MASQAVICPAKFMRLHGTTPAEPPSSQATLSVMQHCRLRKTAFPRSRAIHPAAVPPAAKHPEPPGPPAVDMDADTRPQLLAIHESQVPHIRGGDADTIRDMGHALPVMRRERLADKLQAPGDPGRTAHVALFPDTASTINVC
jgi:hypothetical protein